MKEQIHLFWFRRDLRLQDNCGLYHALNSGKKVLPIFIFDEAILSRLPNNDARVSFLHQELTNINTQLRELGTSLAVFHGKPLVIFEQLLEKYSVETVFTNHDYEPYALQRDAAIKTLLTSKNIGFKTYKDQVIFERNEIVKKDGTAYKVYTPYS
ncbi:MAG: deoxyribodipyrimidine photo-lyase, partial [Polaribacter sp.]